MKKNNIIIIYKMKHCVLYLNLTLCNCKILSVHANYKDSLEAFNKVIDDNKEIQNPSYYKKYHDSQSTISIYKTNYIMTKTLIEKYFIKSYSEPSEIKTIVLNKKE
jgi:hypothetical protein